MIKAILGFFGPLASSIKGSVNLDELTRAIFSAFGVSSLVALAILICNAVAADASKIFSPAVATLATFGLGLVLDLLRRIDHSAPVTQMSLTEQLRAANLVRSVMHLDPLMEAPVVAPVVDGKFGPSRVLYRGTPTPYPNDDPQGLKIVP